MCRSSMSLSQYNSDKFADDHTLFARMFLNYVKRTLQQDRTASTWTGFLLSVLIKFQVLENAHHSFEVHKSWNTVRSDRFY